MRQGFTCKEIIYLVLKYRVCVFPEASLVFFSDLLSLFKSSFERVLKRIYVKNDSFLLCLVFVQVKLNCSTGNLVSLGKL